MCYSKVLLLFQQDVSFSHCLKLSLIAWMEREFNCVVRGWHKLTNIWIIPILVVENIRSRFYEHGAK